MGSQGGLRSCSAKAYCPNRNILPWIEDDLIDRNGILAFPHSECLHEHRRRMVGFSLLHGKPQLL